MHELVHRLEEVDRQALVERGAGVLHRRNLRRVAVAGCRASDAEHRQEHERAPIRPRPVMASFGADARGRSCHRHLDLQLLESIAQALLRRGLDGIAQTLAVAFAAAIDRPADIAVGPFVWVDR